MHVLLGDSSHLLPWLDRLAPLDFSTHTDLRSQFSRAGLDPGLSYQLGLGGVDRFRAIDDRLAVGASRGRLWRLASALRLPLGLSVSAGYSTGAQATWAVRGKSQSETDQQTTSWPDVTGRWTWTPHQSLISKILTNITASATARVVTSSTVQPPLEAGLGAPSDVGALTATQETRSWPLSVLVTWVGHVSTAFGYNVSHSLANQAGSLTQNDRTETSASLAFAFRPPYELLPIKSDIRTSLAYTSVDTKGCINLVDAGSCVSILDAGRQQFNFSMDTQMPPNVSAGISVGYIINNDAYLARKTAQLVLTASVTVNFQAGQAR
jgi:hypothetical protein